MSSNIKIKPSRKGKFTEYCKRRGYGGVTNACIKEAENSNNPSVRKMAVFADNAKHKFKHKNKKGG